MHAVNYSKSTSEMDLIPRTSAAAASFLTMQSAFGPGVCVDVM